MVAAKPKATKPKATKPKERSSAERFHERLSAIRERRRASVLTCERGLQSAIVSDEARLMRTWSKSLRDAEARLLWAEADLEASKKKVCSEQSR